jgi:hypothetical protein
VSRFIAIAFGLLLVGSGEALGRRRDGVDIKVDKLVGFVVVRALEARAMPCPDELDSRVCDQRAVEIRESGLEEVFSDVSEVGDRALVKLSFFYLGESAGEDIAAEIRERGKRMIPYLVEAQQFPPTDASQPSGADILLPLSTVLSELHDSETAICEGRTED